MCISDLFQTRDLNAIHHKRCLMALNALVQFLPNRMTERDSSSVDVDFLGINTQHFDVGQNDDAKGFIDLPHSNVFHLYASGFQNLINKIKSHLGLALSALEKNVFFIFILF